MTASFKQGSQLGSCCLQTKVCGNVLISTVGQIGALYRTEWLSRYWLGGVRMWEKERKHQKWHSYSTWQLLNGAICRGREHKRGNWRQILGNDLRRHRKAEILRFISGPKDSWVFQKPGTERLRSIPSLLSSSVPAVRGLCSTQTPGVSANPASL